MTRHRRLAHVLTEMPFLFVSLITSLPASFRVSQQANDRAAVVVIVRRARALASPYSCQHAVPYRARNQAIHVFRTWYSAVVHVGLAGVSARPSAPTGPLLSRNYDDKPRSRSLQLLPFCYFPCSIHSYVGFMLSCLSALGVGHCFVHDESPITVSIIINKTRKQVKAVVTHLAPSLLVNTQYNAHDVLLGTE